MCDCVFVGTPKSESFFGVWILSLHSVDAIDVRRVHMKYHDNSLYHQIVSYCCHGDGSGGRVYPVPPCRPYVNHYLIAMAMVVMGV